MSIEVSIIMPCLNEAETIGTCILKAQSWLQRSGVNGEIIVGDNGSTDGSQEIARKLGARVVDIPQRGYGIALHEASLAARGCFCIMGDSDDSYDFSDLDMFLIKLRQGYDLVMGNRFLGGVKPGAMPWKNRYIGNPVLSAIGRFLFKAPARDFHCGLRGYSKEALQKMDLRTTGMEYASEMVIKATLLGQRIAEVPTTLSPDGRTRPPHLRPYRDGWRHLRFMLIFSPNWLFLYPGLILMAVGLLAGGVLLGQPIRLHGLRFSVDTLIYCSAMVATGFQAVLFAILSRSFAVQEGLYPRKKTALFIPTLISLEKWLIAGAAAFIAGMFLAFYALHIWQQAGFGELQTEIIARIVVTSSLAIMLGLETVFSGFFLSTLQFGVRHYPSSATAEGLESARIDLNGNMDEAGGAAYARGGGELMEVCPPAAK